MDIRSLLDTLTQLDASIEEAPRERGQGRGQGGGNVKETIN
jgi:hypothetical protein